MSSQYRNKGLIILATVAFFFSFINPTVSFAETINYSYDSVLSLIQAQYDDGTKVDYVYDNVGNPLQKATTLSGSPSNNSPDPASNPDPPDGATEVSTTPTLSWTGGDPDTGDQVVYYVYFGTSTSPSLVSSGWQTSYTPGQLSSMTTYYWKVISRDSHNLETESPLWSFTTGNDPPVVSFTANPTKGWAPLTVQFTDTSTSPDGDEIISWAWDFDGDGNIDSNLQNPTYTYTTGGKYTVSLTVTDEYGASDTETKAELISVCSGDGAAPVADPGGPYTGIEGQEVVFDASQSTASEGWIKWYDWDINDEGIWDVSSSQPTASYIYAQQGTFTIRLRVTDNCDRTAEATTTATISDTSPIVDFTADPTSGLVPLTVWFTDNSTAYDQPLLYEWDFENDGMVDSTKSNPVYTYNEAGTYTVKLTVTDSDGSVSTLTKTDYITVTYPPVRILRETPIYYTTLQEAYDASVDGDTIQVQDVRLFENIYTYDNKTIIIDGGYNNDYSAKSGKTRLRGQMIITGGRVTLKDFIIEK
jgi:PKD repeat protein